MWKRFPAWSLLLSVETQEADSTVKAKSGALVLPRPATWVGEAAMGDSGGLAGSVTAKRCRSDGSETAYSVAGPKPFSGTSSVQEAAALSEARAADSGLAWSRLLDRTGSLSDGVLTVHWVRQCN